MPFASVFRGLGAALIGVAALAAIASLYGLLIGEITSARALGATGFVALFLGVSGFLLGRNLETESGPKEAVALLLSAWTIVPLIASLGFLGVGGIGGLHDAIFEAMSAATTTGASLLSEDSAPRAVILWRSLLEWGGGYLSILTVLVVLVALNLSGPGVQRTTLFTLGDAGLFRRFIQITRTAGAIYGLATLITFTLLTLSGLTFFEAACLALSTPATGGGQPHAGPLGAYVPPAGQLVLAFAMLAGALNYALLWESLRDDVMRPEIAKDPETRGLAGGIVILTLILLLYGAGLTPARIISAMHDAAAVVSTSARFTDPDSVDHVPPTLLMAFVFVGGSAVSTAGGIKIIRFLLLFWHARLELRRLSHPSGVQYVTFRGRRIAGGMFVSLWIYFLGYLGVLGGLMIGITLFGASFEQAVPAAIAVLSNAGPILDVTSVEPIGYLDFTPGSRWVMVAGMALGRMEVLAAIAALAPGLWRR